MKKRDNNKIHEISLLENPNMETQVKLSLWKGIWKFVIVSFLFLILIFGYLMNFSRNSFYQIYGTKFTGTFNSSSFIYANDGDLIIVEQYASIFDIEINDIVCYSTNASKGSGKVVEVQSNIIIVEDEEKTTKRIPRSCIVGKQIKTIACVGAIIEFIGSAYGLVLFNVILLLYIAYLTFSRINYENTEKGKFLLRKYKQQIKDSKSRRKLLKNVEGGNNISNDIYEMLDGNFDQNKEQFLIYKKELKLTVKDKYKYVLKSIYDAYLTKEDLSREERKRIASVIELLCVCKDLDNDIEYMIVDLLLKTDLVSFDDEKFVEMADEFLNAKLDDDDLLNFGSILYILLYKNKKLRNAQFKTLCETYYKKAESLEGKDKEIVVGSASTILNLVK